MGAGMSRPMRRATPRPPAGMPEAESKAWAAATAVLDRVAAEAERRWGVGRLETLVGPETAAKMARAKEQCDEAISAGDMELAAQKAASVARGYPVLEAEAIARGHKPNDVGMVWTVATPERAYALCLHTADVGAVAAQYPDHTAISVLELLRLLEATQAGRIVVGAKEQWPGARVTEFKPTKPAPDWSRGDDLPF